MLYCSYDRGSSGNALVANDKLTLIHTADSDATQLDG